MRLLPFSPTTFLCDVLTATTTLSCIHPIPSAKTIVNSAWRGEWRLKLPHSKKGHQIREIKRSETIPGKKKFGGHSVFIAVFGSLLRVRLLLRLGVIVPVVVVVVPPRAEPVRDEPEGAGVSALAADGLVVVAPVGVAALHADAEAVSEVVLGEMHELLDIKKIGCIFLLTSPQTSRILPVLTFSGTSSHWSAESASNHSG